MRSENDLEQALKEAVHEEVNSIEVPDLDDVWGNIEDNINKKDNSRRTILNKKIAGVVAALLILGITFITTEEGYTYYRRILNLFLSTEGDQVNIELDHRSTNNPPPESNLETTTHNLSLEDAKKKAGFQMGIPAYVPDEYTLQEVLLTQHNKEVLNIEIIYTSRNNELIRILQEPILEEHTEVININSNNATVEQIEKDKITYNIISRSDDRVRIIWDMNQVKYIVDAVIDDDLMEMVFSIK